MSANKNLSSQVRGVSPCTGCTERFRACWDHCPKDERGEFGYKAWKAEVERVKQARQEYIRLNAKKKHTFYGGSKNG